MVNINIEIPEKLHRKIKIYCAINNLTIKDFIIFSLDKNMNIEKKVQKKKKY